MPMAACLKEEDVEMKKNNHLISYQVIPVGVVRSSLKWREECPHQGFEGAPDAWVEIDAAFRDGLEGIAPGCEVILLTWFHEAQRDLLKVHPQNNPEKPLRGVFLTRSPDRPNPLGLHRVRIVEIQGTTRLRVEPLEAIDGTPILDIKPVLSQSGDD